MSKENPNLDLNEDLAPTRAQVAGWILEGKQRAKSVNRRGRQQEIRLHVITKLAPFSLPTPQLDAMLSDLSSYGTYEHDTPNPAREV